MARDKEENRYYAVFIPTGGKYLIFFPDFNHLLPSAPTLDDCPAAAWQFLKTVLLRRILDREPLPTACSRDEAPRHTIDYIQRVRYPLDGDAPLYPVTFDREALDRLAEAIEAFRASNPEEETRSIKEVNI